MNTKIDLGSRKEKIIERCQDSMTELTAGAISLSLKLEDGFSTILFTEFTLDGIKTPVMVAVVGGDKADLMSRVISEHMPDVLINKLQTTLNKSTGNLLILPTDVSK